MENREKLGFLVNKVILEMQVLLEKWVYLVSLEHKDPLETQALRECVEPLVV